MLLFFLIASIILAGFLFCVEVYYNKLSSEIAFLKMIGFFIISIALSFLINNFINPSSSYIPPDAADKDDNSQSIEPNLLKALEKSARQTKIDFTNSLNNESNFFQANKNMFGFFDIFGQMFKKNN